MKKPLLKVYINAPYYNPFDVLFVSKNNKIIDVNNKEYKQQIFYKYIYDSINEIINELNNNFENYKIFYYFNNKKIKNNIWIDS
jgi:hypothetical protein